MQHCPNFYWSKNCKITLSCWFCGCFVLLFLLQFFGCFYVAAWFLLLFFVAVFCYYSLLLFFFAILCCCFFVADLFKHKVLCLQILVQRALREQHRVVVSGHSLQVCTKDQGPSHQLLPGDRQLGDLLQQLDGILQNKCNIKSPSDICLS